MKHLIVALTCILSFVASLQAGFAIPDPATQAVGATDEETYKLYQAVTGAEWDYLWRRTTVQIAFGPDGHITHGPWGHPTWRIIGSHTILLKEPDGYGKGATEMIIRFNPELTRWTCIDWSKGRGEGIRRKPNPAAN
ncbi:MAG TPA: hypothetical protein VGM54_19605 [Chthoniobacter sp.]|jgi:hypothetical protein